MNQIKLKREQLLYIVALILALVVRLAGADRQPLTNPEADLALQALGLARGENPLLGPHPLYLALTTLMMFLFQASSWVARFWPTVAGSLLALTPALFQKQIGRGAAVVLAFGLALDPGLLSVSRQAGSIPLGLLLTLLAFGLAVNGQRVWAGVAAGLAVLGGPSVWPGVLALGIAVWSEGGLRHSMGAARESDEPDVESSQPAHSWGPAGLALLMTVLLGATLFFFIPGGLSALGQSIAVYFRGWLPSGIEPAGTSAVLVLVGLLVYEFLPLVFGLWGGIAGLVRKDPVDRLLLVWWFAALVLAVAYPSRQVADLAWSIVPLWALASRQLLRLVRVNREDRLPVLGQTLLAAVILTIFSMAFVSMANGSPDLRLEHEIRLGGSLVMLIASAGLIAWGWSRQVALRGVTFGLALLLVVYTLAASWNAVGLSGRDGQELWARGARITSADLLRVDLSNFNQWGPQESNGLDVVVADASSPALRWILRDVRRISYVSQIPTNVGPAIVITPAKPELALAASYRGESLVLSEMNQWDQLGLVDWFRWLVFRVAPAQLVQQERAIFWVRSDVFPGGSTNAQPAP